MPNWSLPKKLQAAGLILFTLGSGAAIYSYGLGVNYDDGKLGLIFGSIGLVMTVVGTAMLPKPVGHNIICPNPNCGYRGPCALRPRGQFIVGFLLLLLWVFPGVLYFIFFRGYRYYCPKCWVQIAIDN
jgi:hypothetical protein